MDDPKVDLEGQGQGHQVKKSDIRSHLTILRVIFQVKGHKSSSKVTWVMVEGRPLRLRSPGQKFD